MEYEKIILEMLNRICILEEDVKTLKNNTEFNKVRTDDIVNFILELKKNAKERGKHYIELVANDLHKEFGLKNRMPIVCNAMRKAMQSGDEILHQTKSGYSSTLKIRYNFN